MLRSIPLACVATMVSGASCLAATERGAFGFAEAADVLQANCSACHAAGGGEGGFSIDELAAPESLAAATDRWMTVRERIVERTMPPADAEPLPAEERERLAEWIDDAVLEAILERGPRAGPPHLRRLARHEYANTVRDLLDVHFNAGEDLPEDGAGGEGFTNAAETLTISPIHAEKYLAAATRALDYASRDSSARDRLLAIRPGEGTSEREAAAKNLQRLATRAYRRPVDDGEVERLVAVYAAARDEGLRFDEAVLYAMRGVLISPHFLFILESPPSGNGEAEPVTPHELATRLSYFLWASMPDEELRAAADDGSIATPDGLREQTIRMLNHDSTHLRDSMGQFVGQWLGTADVGAAKRIDTEKHSWWEEPHAAAFRNQPVYVFEEILRDNRSILELIDAEWTYLNRFLLDVYDLDRDEIDGNLRGNLNRFALSGEARRRGSLLSMGGVLAVSAYPRRSSPVLRGVWVLEKMLGRELPPPPPDVPELEESETAETQMTLRERLQRHRVDATCASCHDRIDPMGFTLENFDEVGRWREKDDGGPIDPSAALPDGTELGGLDGLKTYLLDHRREFARELTRKMLGYALGRALRPSDRCTVETVVGRLAESGYNSQELILGIVESVPFRMKR